MSNFLLCGSRRNSTDFSLNNMVLCHDACLTEIDFDNKRILRQNIDFTPDRSVYPDGYTYSLRYGHFDGRKIVTCTHSDIREFDYHSFTLMNRASHPLFNDLHHITKINGKTYFASTGLDRVGSISSSGEVTLTPTLPLQQIRQVSEADDFRSIDTKPHSSHPNYIFELDGQIWVTRFFQRDAVNLDNLEQNIPVATEGIHDGIVHDGRIFFTAVDGRLIVIDAERKTKLFEENLTTHYNLPKLGWCRGLAVIGEHAYIGFTTIRKTKHRENLRWLTNTVESMRVPIPTRIVKFDLNRRRVVDEMMFEKANLSVLFSILPVH